MSGGTPDWVDYAQLLIATVNVGVTAAIAVSVAKGARRSEQVQNLAAVYEQWYKKKELSMTIPAITRADAEIYVDQKLPTNVQIERHQVYIWKVLIVDVLFNSYVAMKKGAYPKEVFDEDIASHFGALAKHDPLAIKEIIETRGYVGEGLVGEFNAIVTRELAKYLPEPSTTSGDDEDGA